MLLSLGLIVRSERDFKNKVVVRVFFVCPYLFVHGFTTVHECGSVELYACSDTGLGRNRKKLDSFVSKNFRKGFFGVFHPRSSVLHLSLLQICTLRVLLGSSIAVR